MAKPAAVLSILVFLLSTSDLALSNETEETRELKDNPYYFSQENFSTPLSTRDGKLRVLQRFSESTSHLVRRIENYRIALLEFNRNTVLIPNHYDAETLVFVVEGSAIITLLHKENRESYKLRRGDLLRVRAGSTGYIINNNNKEKLYIVELFETISVLGQLQAFFGIGGQNPESYYMNFSRNILEAAFNTEYDKVRRVFGQHQEGPFLRFSEEKIRKVVLHASASRGEGRRLFNLYAKPPTYSSQHGRLQEVDANDYPALRDQDIAVSYANIRGGSMEAPYYNSRATMVAVVLDGRGYFEMICPHLSGRRSREEGEQGRDKEEEGEQGRDKEEEGEQGSQEEEGEQGHKGEESEQGHKGEESEQGHKGDKGEESEQGHKGEESEQGHKGEESEQGHKGEESEQGQREGKQESVSYQRVSAKLSPGDVYVVPAGHPFVNVADKGQDLRIVCFEINAEDNKKYMLAGQDNIFKQLNREEREMFFVESEREVQRVLNAQREAGFLEGPKREKGEGERMSF